MRILFCVFPAFVLVLFSCSNSTSPIETDKEAGPADFTYLHISHTKTESNPLMDSEIERIDYSKFDMLWLGGDLASYTSNNDQTMGHVDSIFDLSNSNTLWSLGNHDTASLQRVENFTNRPAYYATHKNDITFLVLNTQDSISSILAEQKEFVYSVLDTIQNSSHLIILHHKLVWMYGNDALEPQISGVSNGTLCEFTYCINPNNFNSEIYPKLVALKEQGIEVICVGGDIGRKVKEFEYVTSDGIYFIASGIEHDEVGNKGLLFSHYQTKELVRWEYKLLTEL